MGNPGRNLIGEENMQFPEFPREEYQARLAKLQESMAAEGMDALLIAAEQNYRYLTGHYTETWLNPSRPMACWLPSDGEPVLVVCETEEEWARTTSWVQDIRVYAGLSVGPGRALGVPEIGFEPGVARALVETARSLGLGPGKRIGREFGSHTRMRLPLEVMRGLEDALEGVAWADSAGLMWEARAIKSELEVAYLQEAVRSLDQAFPALFAGLSPGVTELDVARRLKMAVLGLGADQPGYINVVGDVRNALFSAPSARQLLPGAMMYVDGGAIHHGYWSDYARLAAIGEATDAQRKAYDVMLKATDRGIAAVRPGVTAGEVARAMHAVFEEECDSPDSGFGRVGHGIGLEMPEPPSLHVEDATVLAPGMVICIEPNKLFPDVGYLVLEEMVVVTGDGYELMSVRAPRELLTI